MISQLADFAFECLLALEILEREGRGLSRHNIRHALSMVAPLGTRSDEIDLQWEVVCETLEKTGLVIEREGVFFWKAVNTAADNPALN